MLSLTLLALIGGCTEDDTEAAYEGGTFTITIQDVKDDCYDGTFSVIFMPEGTPTDFQNAVDLPAFEDLPADSTVTLQDPFSDLDVTWEQGDAEDQIVIADATQIDVVLDADSYGDCTVDMVVNVDVTVLDADNIEASAVLTTSGFEHDDCPAVTLDTDDSCDITLSLTGANQAADAD